MVGRAIVDPYLASDLALFFILTARRIRSTCPPPFPLPLNESRRREIGSLDSMVLSPVSYGMLSFSDLESID